MLSFYDIFTEKKEIPWKALRLLTGEIIYGGRVTDHWDQICLLSLSDAFLNEDALSEDFKYNGLEVCILFSFMNSSMPFKTL